jgi:hypothetical protein
MESSLVEFSLDNRSIDEVRRIVSLWHFLIRPPQSQLSGESGEVYLFSWLASVERFLKTSSPVCHFIIVTILSLLIASQDDIKTAQKDLGASLLGVISSREPYPVPGRALRNLVASCILILYTRGDSKNMFDTLIAFLKVAGDFKAPADRDQHKM